MELSSCVSNRLILDLNLLHDSIVAQGCSYTAYHMIPLRAMFRRLDVSQTSFVLGRPKCARKEWAQCPTTNVVPNQQRP
eukprot:8006274-Pyramimonas_sp.AAC.1